MEEESGLVMARCLAVGVHGEGEPSPSPSCSIWRQRKAGFPCPRGCGKVTKYEKPCPGALEVFADLLDSLIVDVATEVHRAARLGLIFFPCEGWAGCEEEQNNGEVQYEHEEEQGAKGSRTVEASTSSGTPDQTSLPQAQQQQAPQSAGISSGKQMAAVVDVFGQTHPAVASESFECLNCGRQVVAGRYAPHLEKCMGKGRISSRVASRIINSTQRRSRTSATGAVASSGSGGSGTGAPRAAPSGACSSSPAIAVLAVATGSTLGTPLSVGSGGAAAMTIVHNVGGSQPSATVSASRIAVGRNPNQTREGSPGSGGIDSVDDADTSISKQDRKKDAQNRGRPSKSRSGKITAAVGGTQKVNRLVTTVSNAREKPKQAPPLDVVAPLLAESTVCANKTNAASSIEEKADVDTSRGNARHLRTDERIGAGRWVGESDVSEWLGGTSLSLEADLDDVPLGSSPMLKRRRKTKSTLLRTVSLAAIDTGKKGVTAKSNGAVYSASVASIGDGTSVNLCIDALEGRHAGRQGREDGRSFAESRFLTDGRTAHVAEAPSSTGTSHNTGLTEACLQNSNETRAHPEGIGNSNTAVLLWQRVAGPVGEMAAASPLGGIDATRLKERVGREPQHAARPKSALVLHDGEEGQAKGRVVGRSGYNRSLTAYGSLSVIGVEGVDGVKETGKEERGIQIPSRKARSVEYAGEVEGVDDVIKVKKRRQRPSTKPRQSVKLGPEGLVGGAQIGGGWVME